MSGRAGNRGYRVQALLSLLESIQQENRWVEVLLDPEWESDKIDILWRYDDWVKITQIKSTAGAFAPKQISDWAHELRCSRDADEYELLLIGYPGTTAIGTTLIGDVRIPAPKMMSEPSLLALTERELDVYVQSRALPQIPTAVREIVVRGLVDKLSEHANAGIALQRMEFDDMLAAWIRALHPDWLIQTGQQPFSFDLHEDISRAVRLSAGRVELVGISRIALVICGLVFLVYALRWVDAPVLWGPLGAISMVPAAIFWTFNRVPLKVYSRRGINPRHYFSVGEGGIARLTDEGYEIRYRSRDCVYGVCRGRLVIVDAPPKERPRWKFAAKCSTECGKEHSYQVDQNWRAYVASNMDWGSLPTQSQ